MRHLETPVVLHRAAQMNDCFFVLATEDFGDAQERLPKIELSVARTEPDGVLDMGVGLLAATDKTLGHADERASGGEIAVDRERLLEFGNALRGPIGVNLNDAKAQMRQRLFRRD